MMGFCEMAHHTVTHSDCCDFVMLIWIISRPVVPVLFVCPPIHFEVYLVIKKTPCILVIADAKTVHKKTFSDKQILLSNLA